MVKKPAVSSTKKSTNEKKSKTVSSNPAKKAVSVVKGAYKSMRNMPLIAAVVAEFIGTFLLVAAIFAVQGQPLYVAFLVAGIVLAIGGASGAFINPAMTIGAWVTGKISSIRALCFTLAEIFGAVVAWLTLNSFLKSAVDTTSQVTTAKLFHAAEIADEKALVIFFAELLGTFILALGFAAAIRAKKASTKAALTYGFATLIALLVAGWVSSMLLVEANTSLTFLNPAVAIAANGVSFKLWPIMIYVIAPLLGGIIGFVISDVIKSDDESTCDC